MALAPRMSPLSLVLIFTLVGSIIFAFTSIFQTGKRYDTELAAHFEEVLHTLSGNDAFYIHDIDATRKNCLITFYLNLKVFDTDAGREYDFDEITLTAIYYEGLAENIRRNYEAWAAHALSFERERKRYHERLDAILLGSQTDE